MITAQQLVNDAWYLSGIVGRGFQTVDGEKSSDGLRFLNDILFEIESTGNLQPYYTFKEVDVPLGASSFFVDNLIECSSVTFAIGNVIYTLIPKGIRGFFDDNYIKGIQSLPYEYYAQRQPNGTLINIYFTTNQDYKFQITGKFSISPVKNTDDLYQVFGGLYISYLKYALAKKMCDFYQHEFDAQHTRELIRLGKMVYSISRPGNVNRFQSILNPSLGVSYGMANLGNGWTP
jgi:hypothetical protein